MILDKINESIDTFYTLNSNDIIREINSNKILNEYTSCNIITAIVETILNYNYENINIDDVVSNVSKLIFSNNEIMDTLNSTNSSYLSGITLISIGLSLVNMDEFADESVKECIKNKELTYDDLVMINGSNISMLSDNTIKSIKSFVNDHNKNSLSVDEIFNKILNNEINMRDFILDADAEKVDLVLDMLKKDAFNKMKSKSLKDKVLAGEGSVSEIIEFLDKYKTQHVEDIYNIYDKETINDVCDRMLEIAIEKRKTKEKYLESLLDEIFE